MEENMMVEKTLLTSALVAGTAIWGWFGWLVLLWAASMATDYVTGTLAALKNREWSSAVAREGLWHKGGMLFVVLVAALTDLAVSLLLRSGVICFPFSYSIALTVIVLSWYTLTELGSTLENATKLTDRVPTWLKRFLKVAADTVDAMGSKAADGREQIDGPDA